MNFYLEKLPWGKILHIENHPERMFSIIENLLGDYSLLGDAFLYDTCVVAALMLIVSGVAPFLRFFGGMISAIMIWGSRNINIAKFIFLTSM